MSSGGESVWIRLLPKYPETVQLVLKELFELTLVFPL